MKHLAERLRRLEAYPPGLDYRRAEWLTDHELERIVADSLGLTADDVHRMSDEDLAKIADGGQP